MSADATADTDQSQAIMFEPIDEIELRAGRGEDARRCEQITFEQGYEELKRIVARLDDPELPIHEMFEGFRRGKPSRGHCAPTCRSARASCKSSKRATILPSSRS